MFREARLKLTAGYAGALSLILLVLGFATFLVVRNALDDDITTSIEVSLRELERYNPERFNPSFHVGGPTRTYNQGGRQIVGPGGPFGQPRGEGELGLTDIEGDEVAAGLLSSDVFYVMATGDGGVVANPRRVNLRGVNVTQLVADAEDGNHWQDVGGEDSTYRIATYATGEAPTGTLYLLVGKSLDARNRNLNTLIQTLLIAGGLGIVLSAGGGWWLAGRALRPIEESLESQRRFVSDASHELRTPVAVVRANNELLQLHPDQRIGENAEQVDAIASEAEHMSRLVEDLLTLARADEGRLAMQRNLVDLGEVAGGVARQLAAVAERKDIRIESACDIALVEGDEGRLRQLVVILVDNAIKYSPAGSAVTLACRRAGKSVELMVRDNGPGIAEADLLHVFDRFYRAEAARTRGEGAGGLGLGLAIAREIALAHGGRLWAESQPGEGATLRLRMRAASS